MMKKNKNELMQKISELLAKKYKLKIKQDILNLKDKKRSKK